MKTMAASLVLMIIVTGTTCAQEMASVPWAEFRQVYRESIERELLEAQQRTAPSAVPFLCHLDDVVYRLAIAKDKVSGEARVSGRVISGTPVPITLFGRDIIISDITDIGGGVLLSGPESAQGVQFLPDAGTNAFHVSLSFFVRVQEDERSKMLSFSIPPALKNTVTLSLSDNLRLLEDPGIADQAGAYHFAASRTLGIRFTGETVSRTNVLDVSGFTAVAASPVVLDRQEFFTSFDENGSVLSVLMMEVPAAAGPQLKMTAIPDVEIWSLTVNEMPRKVYLKDDTWIIPLENERVSRVQLSLLQQDVKLGLQGRLDACLPATGLPSRSLRVGIALPARVQLLSIEGPVSPVSGETWKAPADFIGQPHFFSRAFYKGEGMRLTVSYKEPVK